jgi:arginyl-tRNA synthetase
MADPTPHLRSLLQDAMGRALGPAYADADPVLRASDRADFQANAAMALGKQVGRPPREIADAIVAALDVEGVCSSVEVAGPGFINLTLSETYLASCVAAAAADERLGVAQVESPMTVVVDYSSPNVAKEMHVGHLRSTVIGDALVRVLSFLGHRVVRQNHLGDWGTQFGMLIEHLVEGGGASSVHVADLNALYQEAKRRFDADASFAARARARVVALQSGDSDTLALWHALVEESERHFEQVYAMLSVLLERGDIRGESFYNPLLAPTVAELEARGLTKVDDGAVCVFPPGFAGRDGEPLPLIVQKSDGGFGYAATDLAGVRYRVRELGGDWLIYVVDARQSQHLAMIFAVAEMAGWLGPSGSLPRATHVVFGTILGPDGTPFKTRSGETVRLVDLLEEAVGRAAVAVEAASPHLSADEKDAIAQAVGVGAVKYADLASDRVKDYVFDWEQMLALHGNTSVYLQYAHARARRILGREEAVAVAVPGDAVAGIVLGEPAERALALRLVSFESAVLSAVEGLQPHRLCTYLFELASAFTDFYEACPVLRAASDELRASRLGLCEVTARTLECGLGLLGIAAPERM